MKENFLNINAQKNHEIKINKLPGNTKQETTEGLQQLDTNKFNGNQELNGIKITQNSDKTINIHGTATENTYIGLVGFKPIPDTQYYLSSNIQYDNVNANLSISVIYSTGTKYLIINSTIKFPTEEARSGNLGFYIGKGKMVNIDNAYFMLVKGDQPKPYEPYTGGQASPNPEFPQEIESVKAYNLFDINSVNNNINCKKVENSIISNTSSADYFNWGFKFTPIKIKANEKKYLKFKCKLENGTYNNTFNQITMSAENGKQIRCNPILQYKFSNEFQEFIYSFTSTENLELNKMFAQLFTGLNNASINMKDILISNENKPYQPYGEIEVKQNGKNIIDLEYGDISSKTGLDMHQLKSVRSKEFIPIKENQIISEYNNIPQGLNIRLYDKNKKYLGYSAFNAKHKFINNNPNVKFFRIRATTNEMSLEDAKITIIYGDNEINEYIPYKETIYPLHLGNIELNKIGDSQDYFHRINGKWHLHKEIEKSIFNGTEIWKKYGKFGNGYLYFIEGLNLKPKFNSLGVAEGFCNYFNFSKTANDKEVAPYCRFKFKSGGTFYIAFEEDLTLEYVKQWLKDNPTEIVYQLETPKETEITDPVLIEDLDRLEKIQLYEGTNIFTSNSDILMNLDYTILKLIDDPDLIDFYISSNGYLIIPEINKKYLINSTESNLPSMPEAVEKTVRVAGRDGDIVLNTNYEPMSFEIVCYTEDGLTREQKIKEEQDVNIFLNSIKNETKRLGIEDGNKYYDVKYNGALTRIMYPAHLQFNIPLKSSDSYAKDIVESEIIGNGNKVSETVKEVGAIITLKGPAQTPKFSLNDYNMFYNEVLLEKNSLEINTNNSTITLINGTTGKRSNAMRAYNHEFPKIKKGNNTLKALSGINNDKNLSIKWNDLKL